MLLFRLTRILSDSGLLELPAQSVNVVSIVWPSLGSVVTAVLVQRVLFGSQLVANIVCIAVFVGRVGEKVRLVLSLRVTARVTVVIHTSSLLLACVDRVVVGQRVRGMEHSLLRRLKIRVSPVFAARLQTIIVIGAGGVVKARGKLILLVLRGFGARRSFHRVVLAGRHNGS